MLGEFSNINRNLFEIINFDVFSNFEVFFRFVLYIIIVLVVLFGVCVGIYFYKYCIK